MILSYELAKELKAGGFPQEIVPGQGYRSTGRHIVGTKYEEREEVYFPTLSELIEACGERFGKLIFVDSTPRWHVISKEENINQSQLGRSGYTPEEAVALLWLVIQKDVHRTP